MREERSNQGATRKVVQILGICFLVSILINLLFTKNNEGISIEVKDDHLSLSYSMGDTFNVNYIDILSVSESRDLELGQYISGIETKTYKFGAWENNEFGEYHLAIYANVDSYIVVKTTNDSMVFNFESTDATDSFYKAFLELRQIKQVQATL